MATRFPTGLSDIKIGDLHTYKIALLSEPDLNLIQQKCLETLSAGGSDSAKAMIDMINAEKNLRAAKSSRRAMIVWSALTVLSLLSVGVLIAWVIYSSSYSAGDDDDQNSCDQNQEYSV